MLMESKCFDTTVLMRIDKGEEVLATLTEFCTENAITLASVSALGAAGEIRVGLFDTDTKEYNSLDFTGIFEITSIVGTISTMEGKVYPHLHITFSDKDCKAFGGHLNRCVISATCELVLNIINGTVDRELSPDIGLKLFKFD